MAENSKRRKPAEIAEVNAALDAIALELKQENEGKDCAPYTVKFGGELHKRYVDWRKEHPDDSDIWVSTIRDITHWDEVKKPKISKKQREGQGILAFYDADGHLPIDQKGGRVRFADATVQQMDAWWEVQEKENEIQQDAHAAKRRIYRQVRSHFNGPKDRMERIMRDVFNWAVEEVNGSAPAAEEAEEHLLIAE